MAPNDGDLGPDRVDLSKLLRLACDETSGAMLIIPNPRLTLKPELTWTWYTFDT